MVVDCAIFFNEVELLHIRLAELSPVVDQFIFVESNVTFAGNPKPFYLQKLFQESGELSRYWPKVRVVELTAQDFAGCHTAWQREYASRNILADALRAYPDDTTIMLSDMDEIPRAAALPTDVAELHMLTQRLSYYYLNCVAPGFVAETRMFPKSLLDSYSPQIIRQMPGVLSENGGWHFSFLGGVERIQAKIAAYSHQELNRPDILNNDHLTRRLAEGTDLFGRSDCVYAFESLDSSYPQYVLDNQHRYQDLIWTPKENL